MPKPFQFWALCPEKEHSQGGLAGVNYGDSVEADDYVGIICPTGETFMLTPEGWSEAATPYGSEIQPVPFYANISISTGFAVGPSQFASVALPSEMPPIDSDGEYRFMVALSRPGTMEWIGDFKYAGISFDAGG